MQTRILFVDDEPHVIAGLQRTLRSMRHEWDMCFANSGAQALETMAQQPFDVIVTDMRMPGMDGARLLTEVLKRYPHVVRIMLSGHSDQEVIMQSIGPTHQYLAKPCEVSRLKETVGNACALRDMLASPPLQRMIAEMEMLPCLPSLYAGMMEAAQSPEPPLTAIGSLIAQDVGMTAKMLQLVNSAFFGLPRRVTSAVEAVNLLGPDTVRALIFSFHVFPQVDASLTSGFCAESLWRHSLRVANLAKRIAFAEGGDRRLCEDAYTAGLLHDSGKVVLALHLPDLYALAQALARTEKMPLIAAEKAVFGASHAEVGAYLMGLWGLPHAIVEALAFHHSPSRCPTTAFGPLMAVHAADCLEHAACPEGVTDAGMPLDYAYLAALNRAERVACWQEMTYAMTVKEGAE